MQRAMTEFSAPTVPDTLHRAHSSPIRALASPVTSPRQSQEILIDNQYSHDTAVAYLNETVLPAVLDSVQKLLVVLKSGQQVENPIYHLATLLSDRKAKELNGPLSDLAKVEADQEMTTTE